MRGAPDLQLVFVYMLSNCDPIGVIDVVPEVITDATGLSLERVQAAISALEGPDPRSRSPLQDGARIERLDDHRTWGWRVVNHGKYLRLRNMEDRRQQTKEATAKWRQKKRDHAVSSGEHGEPIQIQIQTQTLKDLAKDEALGRFNVFWPIYPRKVAKPAALKAWKAQKIHTQDELDRVVAGLKKHIEVVWPGKEKDFIPHPATWINQRRWEDDLTPAAPQSAPEGSVEALEARLAASRKRLAEIEGGRT